VKNVQPHAGRAFLVLVALDDLDRLLAPSLFDLLRELDLVVPERRRV
jgi:hypothetical protein